MATKAELKYGSPAYWIDVAQRAYADGVNEALPAINLLIEQEAAGRLYIPGCQWGEPKPWDIQDISRRLYDWWRVNDR